MIKMHKWNGGEAGSAGLGSSMRSKWNQAKESRKEGENLQRRREEDKSDREVKKMKMTEDT